MENETNQTNSSPRDGKPTSFVDRTLNTIERVGNKLPDPAALFLILLIVVWILSALLSTMTFAEIDPRNDEPIVIHNQLTGTAIAAFLSHMVKTFMNFDALGVVLVAMLGIGVAEHTGFINAALKGLLSFTSVKLLTPMLILVAIISHTAADAGYVLVIPLGGVIFYTAGRHPLAGIAAAFAGVSGAFSANLLPSSLDPMLAGITQSSITEKFSLTVNPLSNWYFTAASCIVIIAVGWYLTDRVIEPRLKDVKIDGDINEMPKMKKLGAKEKCGLVAGLITFTLGIVILTLISLPESSPMRSPFTYRLTGASLNKLKTAGLPENILKKIETMRGKIIAEVTDSKSETKFETEFKALIGEDTAKQYEAILFENTKQSPPQLTTSNAPLMRAIVPLIFLLFILPGIVYGYAAKTVKSHRDIVEGMIKSIGAMSRYIVLMFFAALFIEGFNQSNIGTLLALKGAGVLQSMPLPKGVMIVGFIILTALVNFLIPPASAKWSLLAPIFVPMLIKLGHSPELSQAAYRIGSSPTNIINPLLPYFPLILTYAQKYVKDAKIGTLISLMLPYSIAFLVTWTIFLIIYWWLGISLGLEASYTYPPDSLTR